jgi:hypothetical protein
MCAGYIALLKGIGNTEIVWQNLVKQPFRLLFQTWNEDITINQYKVKYAVN